MHYLCFRTSSTLVLVLRGLEGAARRGVAAGRQTVQAHLLILLIHAHLARADCAPDLSVN